MEACPCPRLWHLNLARLCPHLPPRKEGDTCPHHPCLPLTIHFCLPPSLRPRFLPPPSSSLAHDYPLPRGTPDPGVHLPYLSQSPVGTSGQQPGPIHTRSLPTSWLFPSEAEFYVREYICHANEHGPQGGQRETGRSNRRLTPILGLKSQLSASMTAPAATTNSFLGPPMEVGLSEVSLFWVLHQLHSQLTP